jgi:hypothetical protein
MLGVTTDTTIMPEEVKRIPLPEGYTWGTYYLFDGNGNLFITMGSADITRPCYIIATSSGEHMPTITNNSWYIWGEDKYKIVGNTKTPAAYEMFQDGDYVSCIYLEGIERYTTIESTSHGISTRGYTITEPTTIISTSEDPVTEPTTIISTSEDPVTEPTTIISTSEDPVTEPTTIRPKIDCNCTSDKDVLAIEKHTGASSYLPLLFVFWIVLAVIAMMIYYREEITHGIFA